MNLFIESTFIILLSLCICYLWALNKKIVSLQNSKNDLASMLYGFNDAILRAEKNINELKTLATHTQSDIKTQIDKAKFLSDDLSFMTERASHLADKLDNIISISRNIQNSLGMATDQDYKNLHNNTKQDDESLKNRRATIESLLQRISSAKKTKKIEYSDNIDLDKNSLYKNNN